MAKQEQAVRAALGSTGLPGLPEGQLLPVGNNSKRSGLCSRSFRVLSGFPDEE